MYKVAPNDDFDKMSQRSKVKVKQCHASFLEACKSIHLKIVAQCHHHHIFLHPKIIINKITKKIINITVRPRRQKIHHHVEWFVCVRSTSASLTSLVSHFCCSATLSQAVRALKVLPISMLLQLLLLCAVDSRQQQRIKAEKEQKMSFPVCVGAQLSWPIVVVLVSQLFGKFAQMIN